MNSFTRVKVKKIKNSKSKSKLSCFQIMTRKWSLKSVTLPEVNRETELLLQMGLQGW